MSELLQPPLAPTEADVASNKLASLEKYKESAEQTTPEETTTPHLQLVKSESAPALPQRVRLAEVEAPAEVETPAEEQKPETRPAFQRIDETNAQENLDKLRASQNIQTSTPVENETPAEYTGKHIDTTVETDSASRATELSGEHRDTTVGVDTVSRAPEFGGERRAGQHVSEVEATSDSEIQTGGKHLAESEAGAEAQEIQSLSWRRKIAAAISRRLFRKSK